MDLNCIRATLLLALKAKVPWIMKSLQENGTVRIKCNEVLLPDRP
jgi:hypothetical protein